MVEYLRVFRHVGFFVLGYARREPSKESHDYYLSTRLVNDEHAHRGDCVVDEHWHSDRSRAIQIGVWCSK